MKRSYLSMGQLAPRVLAITPKLEIPCPLRTPVGGFSVLLVKSNTPYVLLYVMTVAKDSSEPCLRYFLISSNLGQQRGDAYTTRHLNESCNLWSIK